MSEPVVLYEKVDEHIVLITMNRPEALNALNRELSRTMAESVERFKQDDDLWVAIITGAGRAFCVGRDLKERADSDDAGNAPARPSNGVVVTESFKPMIAAINGYAMGGGWGRAQSCDIRIMSSTAQIGITEARWHLLGGFAPTLLGQIPLSALMELCLTAEPIGAQRAYDIGFVNKVVEPEELIPTALEYARKITRNSPLSVRAHKEIIMRAIAEQRHDTTRVREIYDKLLEAEDAVEGPRAFRDKRQPVWKGR